MSKYTEEIKSASADIKDAGSPIVFSTKPVKAFDMVTDRPATKQAGTHTAYAIENQIGLLQGSGNASAFQAGTLKERQTRRWMVEAKSLAGYRPEPGHFALWQGKRYTVTKATPLAPDGVPITWTVEGVL